jgi:hypothetical protein
VSARLVLTGGRVGSYSWIAPPCFIEFFKEFFCVPQGFMLCRVAVGGAVAMLSIFKKRQRFNATMRVTRARASKHKLPLESVLAIRGARVAKSAAVGYKSKIIALPLLTVR